MGNESAWTRKNSVAEPRGNLARCNPAAVGGVAGAQTCYQNRKKTAWSRDGGTGSKSLPLW